MKASLKIKLLRKMSIDYQQLSDIELLRTYICQELLSYRREVKQYRYALADRAHYKHIAMTPHPQEPFVNQIVTQAINELLRCERTSLARLTFLLFMLHLDMEETMANADTTALNALRFDPGRHLN